MRVVKKRIYNNENGFTFVELLVTIAIGSILAAATVPIYGNFQNMSQLNESTTQAVQILRQAREQSLAGMEDSVYGVYFQSNAGNDKIYLYRGNSFATRATEYDRVTVLESSLSLATDLSGDEIVFSKGLGEPDNTGTVTITGIKNSKTIAINSLGMVEQN